MGKLAEWRTFWGQFREQFQATGAVLPSSRFLASAIVAEARQDPAAGPVLEAGPGTGAFTDPMIRLLEPGDRLVLVELNEQFVKVLRQRLETEPAWAERKDQVEIIHTSVAELPAESRFDAIVCGLPFNNFEPPTVETLLSQFMDRLPGGGTFSFFEYIAIRRLKSPFVASAERRRLQQVADILAGYLRRYRIGTRHVPLNVPPAAVHHLRKP